MRAVNARFDGWEVHRLDENDRLHTVFGLGVLPRAGRWVCAGASTSTKVN